MNSEKRKQSDKQNNDKLTDAGGAARKAWPGASVISMNVTSDIADLDPNMPLSKLVEILAAFSRRKLAVVLTASPSRYGNQHAVDFALLSLPPGLIFGMLPRFVARLEKLASVHVDVVDRDEA